MPILLDRLALYRLVFTALIFGSSSLLVAASNGWHFSVTFWGVLSPLIATAVLTIVYLLSILRFPNLRISKTFLAMQYLVDALLLVLPIALSGGTSSVCC